jgi:hypothetical protein
VTRDIRGMGTVVLKEGGGGVIMGLWVGIEL